MRIKHSLLGLLLSLLAMQVSATSVLQLSSTELVNRAELVFQGEVIQRISRQLAGGRIVTEVEFLVLDVIKGENPGPGLRLRFTGGAVAGRGLSTGTAIPQVGEQGIYFVSSLTKRRANPLVGWAQGHFTIGDDNQVRAGNGGLVTAISAREASAELTVSGGVARGFSTVSAGRSGMIAIRGLSPEEFKYQVKELAAGRGLRFTSTPSAAANGASSARDPSLWARETP
ncbi:MAG: hypothetical protein AAGI11_16015 [Pseudomonadota bacterium]